MLSTYQPSAPKKSFIIESELDENEPHLLFPFGKHFLPSTRARTVICCVLSKHFVAMIGLRLRAIPLFSPYGTPLSQLMDDRDLASLFLISTRDKTLDKQGPLCGLNETVKIPVSPCAVCVNMRDESLKHVRVSTNNAEQQLNVNNVAITYSPS